VIDVSVAVFYTASNEKKLISEIFRFCKIHHSKVVYV